MLKQLPNIDRMDRDMLIENIRQVERWETSTIAALQHSAKISGCPVRPGGSPQDLIQDMINWQWGDRPEETKATPKVNAWEDKAKAKATAMPSPSEQKAPRKEDRPQERPKPTTAPMQQETTAPSQPSSCSAQGAARRSKSTPSLGPMEADKALASEVKRIHAAKDFRMVLGFAVGETMTLQLANSRYRQLMLLLHPDKRTDKGIASAGGLEACDKAYEQVMEAIRNAQSVLKNGPASGPHAVGARGRPASSAWAWTPGAPSSSTSGKARPSAHPPPPTTPAPPPKSSRPASPPGSKPHRAFGWGPLDPLPPPHPNFGALRIIVVD